MALKTQIIIALWCLLICLGHNQQLTSDQTELNTLSTNIQTQISSCLGNCYFCDPSAPSVCLGQSTVTGSSSTESICVPFYKGANCSQHTLAYEVTGWNFQNTGTCQLLGTGADGQDVAIGGDAGMLTSLGPMSGGNKLLRNFLFPSGAATNRLMVKFAVSVDDPSILDYFNQQANSNNSTSSSSNTVTTQTVQTVQADGTIIYQTITTVNQTNTTENSANGQNSILTQIVREFLLIELIDVENGSNVIEQAYVGYSGVSPVRTSCGYVYQFQLGFDLKRNFTSLALRMSINNQDLISQGAQWNLISFQTSVGCRGYVVSSTDVSSAATTSTNCNTCISGFYPVYSPVKGLVEECRLCDTRCKTCASATVCLTCAANTVYNSNSRMCEFSQNFKSLSGYELVTGQSIPSSASNSQLFGPQVIQSQGGVVEINQRLGSSGNFQPYTITFDMLYSAAFRNSGQMVEVLIDDKKVDNFSAQTLPLYAATNFSGISGSSPNVYLNQVSYTVNESIANSLNPDYSNLKIRLVSNTNNAVIDQFGVANVKFVQFHCSQNCLRCNYSEFTQLSVCIKCGNFFDLSTNCLKCANGFYLLEQANIEQTCIKCHSTCRQCSGPSISECSQCFSGFELGPIQYKYGCINCLYQRQSESNSSRIPICQSNPLCLYENPLDQVLTNIACKACLEESGDINNLTESVECQSCWISQRLAQSSCQPISERGYQLYGSDISNGVISSQWKSNKTLTLKNFNSQYTDMYGVDYVPSTQSADQGTSGSVASEQTTMTFTEQSLPSHRGLTIFFNLMKLNTWGSEYLDNLQNQSINIEVKSGNNIVRNETIAVNNEYGNNIIGNTSSGNEMLYTFFGQFDDHASEDQLQVKVSSSHSGIFVKDMEMYLGNCAHCSGNRIDYQIYYIPMYSTNSTQTGLDIWLEFSQGVAVQASDKASQKEVLNSFQFSVDQVADYNRLLDYEIRQNHLDDWGFVKYFVPLNQSLLNATLRVNNSLGYNVYSKVANSIFRQQEAQIEKRNRESEKEKGNSSINMSRNLLSVEEQVGNGNGYISSNSTYSHRRILLNQRLSAANVQSKISRYENINSDERTTMEQLEEFFTFFNWFTLFTMIVLCFFGKGVVFEEFSILIQLLFLHVYISTNILPATYKRPVSAMEKMENLNFFAYPHARGIEDSWFAGVKQESPFPLTQYNADVYFARSFYPVIIINLIYLGWFLILFILHKFVKAFRNSPLKVIKFFRDIPQRPLNYFDQIWRYQFITVMFSAFIQFHDFDGPTAPMRLNLALCIIAFVITLIYPIYVMAHTYRQHLVLNIEHFLYLYNDIYYRKISSIADKTSYYLYIAVRFGRYFFFALFIALFIFQDIIAPVILLAVTILELIYIFNFKIFRDKLYLAFKTIQNVGFIVLQILILIVYGFSDDTITNEGYQSLGYGICALYILMIINGIIRFFYLAYKKIRDFISGRYDYGEKGELENYDNRNPVVTMQNIPGTERALKEGTDRNINY